METSRNYICYTKTGWSRLELPLVVLLLGLYFHNLYAELRVRSLSLLLQQVLMVIGAVFLIQALLAYLNADVVVSRRLMIIAAALTVALFPPWRKLYTNVLYKGFGIERLLFLGTDVTGAEIAEELVQKPELGFTGVGFIDDKSEPGSMVAGGLHVLGPLATLPEIITKTRPDRIIVNLAERRQVLPVDLLLDLRFSGILIEEAAGLYEATFGRITTRRLRPSQLIFSARARPPAMEHAVADVVFVRYCRGGADRCRAYYASGCARGALNLGRSCTVPAKAGRLQRKALYAL